MKKALSALLVAVVVLGLAAPLAIAAPNIVGPLDPASATIYLQPDPDAVPAQSSSIDVLLPASHTGCGAACRIYWDVVDTLGNNLVGFRPEDYITNNLQPTPRPDNTSIGDMFMTLFARAEGTVTVYAECQVCGDAWSIEVTVVAPEIIEDPPFGLFEILRSWWYDLKWTWDYQIHPFFKYCYFSFCGWMNSAWTLLINAISSLFN